MSFNDVFGGELIFPSLTSYNEITTAVDVVLQWAREQQIEGINVVADWMDIDASAPGLNIDMPAATNTSTGNKVTFNNIGANTYTVRDDDGGTIQSVASGEQWVVILTDNSTSAGTWITTQLGATVSVASAGALAGAGIKAITNTLNQKIDSDVENATPFTAVDGDRAKCLVYTAGAGTCNLTAAGTLGNDWFFMLRNSGSGTLNVLPPAGNIDGGASLNLDPGDSCFIFTDGTDFFTVGLSSGSTIAFDFVSIAVPGSGDFVLSGANLNRISYRFTGALTGNRRIVVPNTTQQYWVDNQTSGAFTLEISTAAGSGQLVTQGASIITYCDSTDVIDATSATSITLPISVAQGGTGATTVLDAQTNLEVPPEGRNLVAGVNLAGGGDLTMDRTFDVEFPFIVLDSEEIIFGTGSDVTIDFVGNDMLFTAMDGVTFKFIGGTVGAEDMLELAPNDAVFIYFDGVVRLATTVVGADVFGTLLDLNNSLAATPAEITARNSEGGMTLRADGGGFLLIQTDSAGVAVDTWISGTQNADVALFHNNVETARSDSLANGGMEVNNTVTGGGFERVLTTADLAAAGIFKSMLTSDVVYNNDSSAAVISDLTITGLNASHNYRIEVYLEYDHNGSDGIRVQQNVGYSNAELVWNLSWIDGIVLAMDVDRGTSISNISDSTGANVNKGVSIVGMCTGQTTFGIRSAQNSADVSDTTVHEGSYVILTRVDA